MPRGRLFRNSLGGEGLRTFFLRRNRAVTARRDQDKTSEPQRRSGGSVLPAAILLILAFIGVNLPASRHPRQAHAGEAAPGSLRPTSAGVSGTNGSGIKPLNQPGPGEGMNSAAAVLPAGLNLEPGGGQAHGKIGDQAGTAAAAAGMQKPSGGETPKRKKPRTIPSTLIELDGSISTSPDGSPLTFAWTQISGPKVDLSNPASDKPSFRTVWPGTYVFELVVTANELQSEPHVVQLEIEAENQPPVAKVMPEIWGQVGKLLEVDGGASFDPEEEDLTYQWQTLTPGLDIPRDALKKPVLAFEPTRDGVFEIQLVVSDGDKSSRPARCRLHINPKPLPPVARARVVTLGGAAAPASMAAEETAAENAAPPDTEKNPPAAAPAAATNKNSPAKNALTVGADAESPLSLPAQNISLVESETIALNTPALASAGAVAENPLAAVPPRSISLTASPAAAPASTPAPTQTAKVLPQPAAASATAPASQALAGAVSIPTPARQTAAAAKLPLAASAQEKTSPAAAHVLASRLNDYAHDISPMAPPAIMDPPARIPTPTLNDLPAPLPPLPVDEPSAILNSPGNVPLQPITAIPAVSTLASSPSLPPLPEISIGSGRDHAAAGLLAPPSALPAVDAPRPIAHIDGPEIITLDKTVMLDARSSISPSGNRLTYMWQQKAGPYINSFERVFDGAAQRFLAPRVGDYEFELVVVDGGVDSEPVYHRVRVVEGREPPVAVVLAPARANIGAVVRMDARQSYDHEGDRLIYRWRQTGGPAVRDYVVDEAAGDAAPAFRPAQPGLYSFELIVSNGKMNSKAVDIDIEVGSGRPAPGLAVSGPEVANAGERLFWEAIPSDVDGHQVTFQWRQLEGPAKVLAQIGGSRAMVAPPAPGRYVVEVSAMEGGDTLATTQKVLEVFRSVGGAARSGPPQPLEPLPELPSGGTGNDAPTPALRKIPELSFPQAQPVGRRSRSAQVLKGGKR